MGEPEAAVRELFKEFEGYQWDEAQVERIAARMADDAQYRVFAWQEPFVGRAAIAAELLRQAPLMSELSFDILSVASVGRTVFVERIDYVVMNERHAGFHVVGVFEINEDGKIASWRDYVDSKEIVDKVYRKA